jgi:hypothetical protein
MSINQPPGFVYVSAGLLDTMRRQVRKFLMHSYTRESRTSVGSTTDDWGQQSYTFGAKITGIPCFYAVREIPIPTPEGMTTLNLPILTCGFDDPIQVGDLVSNIQTADGSFILTGPVVVESLQPRDPNMGGPVLIEAHLRDVEFVPTSETPT